MDARISVSAICTFEWPLAEDLAFYARSGIENVGISLAKLDRAGWDDGVAAVVDAGLRVTNLIGLGPFHLARPAEWPAQQERLVRALHVAEQLDAECLVITTGPAADLSWEAAADALEVALAPVLVEAARRGIPFALEHTNSLRVDVGFVHTLPRRTRPRPTVRRRGVYGDQRLLGRAEPRGDHSRRRWTSPPRAGQ